MKKFEVIFAVTERTLYRSEIEAESPEAALITFDATSEQVDWEDVEIIDREIDPNSVRIENEKLPMPISAGGGNKIIKLPWIKWLKERWVVEISDPVEVANIKQNPNVEIRIVNERNYLAYPDGEICQYFKGEAIKKARMFGGRIVKN